MQPPLPFRDVANELRAKILLTGNDVRSLMNHAELSQLSDGASPGEAKANIMLAYRHLEDARMRLGKALQAMDGGTSIYDR